MRIVLTAAALAVSLVAVGGMTSAAFADASPTPTVLPTGLPTPTPTPTPTPSPKPEVINKTILIGHSVQGRPIYAYRRNAINSSRRVLLIGNIHGDEAAGDQAVRYLRDYMSGFQRGIEVWIIITVNPDGNALHTRQNARHVDLNRNFPWHWQYDSTRQYYSGSSAASEPETKALVGFLRTYRPHTEVIFHQPLDCVDLSNSTSSASSIMSHYTGLPMRTLGTRHGSQAGYTQALVPGSIVLTTEFGYSASPTMLIRAENGMRAVANSR